MPLFHDEDDGPDEPVRGLPQKLPKDEEILWQGSAAPKPLAIHAFHIRTVSLYLAAAALLRGAFGLASGQPVAEALATSATILLLAGLGAGVLWILGWSMARGSLFTITNRRVVIRHGVAIRKYINIPFKDVRSVDLRLHAAGHGDIALSMSNDSSVPYFHLWPFARPMRFTRTVPLLRALPDAAGAALVLTKAINAAADGSLAVSTQEPRKPAQKPAIGAILTPEVSPT